MKAFIFLCFLLQSYTVLMSKNEELEDYFKKVLENLRDHMTEGIPELNIPVLDPFALEDLHLNEQKGTTKFDLSVTSGIITGLSHFDIEAVSIDAGYIKADVALNFLKLRNDGYYKVDGIIVGLFPIFGNGTYWLEAEQVKVKLDIDLQVSIQMVLKVQNISFSSVADKITAHFNNLLGGGSAGDLINDLIDHFGKKILDQHLPEIFTKVSSAIKEKLNEELKKFPIGSLKLMPTY